MLIQLRLTVAHPLPERIKVNMELISGKDVQINEGLNYSLFHTNKHKQRILSLHEWLIEMALYIGCLKYITTELQK